MKPFQLFFRWNIVYKIEGEKSVGFYLESRTSVVDPTDDEIGVLEVSAGRQAKDQVAEGAHLDFESDLTVVDRPVHVVVGVQSHPVHPSGVR